MGKPVAAQGNQTELITDAQYNLITHQRYQPALPQLGGEAGLPIGQGVVEGLQQGHAKQFGVPGIKVGQHRLDDMKQPQTGPGIRPVEGAQGRQCFTAVTLLPPALHPVIEPEQR